MSSDVSNRLRGAGALVLLHLLWLGASAQQRTAPPRDVDEIAAQVNRLADQ